MRHAIYMQTGDGSVRRRTLLISFAAYGSSRSWVACHSLSSEFATEGRRQGIVLPALMAMTEHRSVASVIVYFQADGITDNLKHPRFSESFNHLVKLLQTR